MLEKEKDSLDFKTPHKDFCKMIGLHFTQNKKYSSPSTYLPPPHHHHPRNQYEASLSHSSLFKTSRVLPL